MHLTAWPWVRVASDVICVLKHDFENVPRQNRSFSTSLPPSHSPLGPKAQQSPEEPRVLAACLFPRWHTGSLGMALGHMRGRESWGKQVCSPSRERSSEIIQHESFPQHSFLGFISWILVSNPPFSPQKPASPMKPFPGYDIFAAP